MFFARYTVKYITSDLIHEIYPMPPYGKMKSNFFYKYLSEVSLKLDQDEICTWEKKMVNV